MSTSRSKKRAGASGGDGSPPPSPTKLTRGALKGDKQLSITPSLLEPEPRKNRKMCRTVVVDHTGETPPLFVEKANAIRVALEAAVAQVEVVINDQVIREGCFVVREEGGEVFVQLVDMVSPFPELRDLDVDLLVARIVRALVNNMAFENQD
ncbi:hypothetical protein ACS0TY_036003 [Phlomoides rotata]